MGNRYRYRRRRSNRRQYATAQRRDDHGLVGQVLTLLVAGVRFLWRKWRGRHAASNAVRASDARSPALPPMLPTPSLETRAADPLAPLPYRKARRLLSEGEYAAWVPLYHAVRGKYRIFCKVRLADVVSCPRHRADERRWFRKIGRYHVDFVICDPQTTEPLLVIELHDRRHRERIRRARDDFKDAVLRAAGMPLYRIPAQQAYDPIELGETISRLIATAAGPRP